MPDPAPQAAPDVADLELLVLPYDSAQNRSLLHVLIEEFKNASWTRFQSAVAFIGQSGNFPELLRAILAFAHRGARVEMTFGADSFGPDGQGSDYQAIERLLQALDDEATVRIHLYHEGVRPGRIFHPKLYLFSNVDEKRAFLIVGSSNWSAGGLALNVEASLLARLDLRRCDHLTCFTKAQECFEQYWSEQ